MGAPDKCDHRGDRERQKPGRLVVRRRDREIQGRAGLVPHAAVVARRDAEAVIAGTKIVVERLAARADVLPVTILALELVAEPHLLRRDKTERRVVDLQIARQRGQAEVRICEGIRIVGLAVGDDLLDMHGRRKTVERQAARIHDADAGRANEPQSPIGSLADW